MSEKILVKLKGEDDNGCPAVTPKQLLEEKSTPQDLVAVEYVMGRFTSTTSFLDALKQVLFGLEAFAECALLDKLVPIMAQVESSAMNGDSTTIRVEGSEKELHLVEHNPAVKSIQDYPRVENGELLNSGESEDSPPRYLQLAHDYLGAPPSPNGE